MRTGAWATELELNTGMTVRVMPGAGTALLFRWLREGTIDLLAASMPTMRNMECYRPEQRVPDGGPFPARVIMATSISASGFMVRADGPIKTIYDIGPETRVTLSAETLALLDWLGLKDAKTGEWKVKLIPFGGAAASVRAVPQGKADLAFASPTSPVTLDAASGRHGIRFLELPVDEDPEGAERFKERFPLTVLGPAPHTGVKEIWGVTTMLGYQMLLARAGLPTELAYQLVKWFDENCDLYQHKAPSLDEINLETFRRLLDYSACPIHDGSIKYLKEKGVWTADDDARQEYNLRLLQPYIDAWDKALDRAAKQGIKVSPESVEFAELWSSVKKELGMPGYRTMDSEQIKEGLAQLDQLGF